MIHFINTLKYIFISLFFWFFLIWWVFADAWTCDSDISKSNYRLLDNWLYEKVVWLWDLVLKKYWWDKQKMDEVAEVIDDININNPLNDKQIQVLSLLRTYLFCKDIFKKEYKEFKWLKHEWLPLYIVNNNAWIQWCKENYDDYTDSVFLINWYFKKSKSFNLYYSSWKLIYNEIWFNNSSYNRFTAEIICFKWYTRWEISSIWNTRANYITWARLSEWKCINRYRREISLEYCPTPYYSMFCNADNIVSNKWRTTISELNWCEYVWEIYNDWDIIDWLECSVWTTIETWCKNSSISNLWLYLEWWECFNKDNVSVGLDKCEWKDFDWKIFNEISWDTLSHNSHPLLYMRTYIPLEWCKNNYDEDTTWAFANYWNPLRTISSYLYLWGDNYSFRRWRWYYTSNLVCTKWFTSNEVESIWKIRWRSLDGAHYIGWKCANKNDFVIDMKYCK